MTIAAGIFRQYDIRGIVGHDLTTEAARAIGARVRGVSREHASARGAVVVGRDNRPSGAALRDALVGGLTDAGVDVVDIGVVPTPLNYWALHHLPRRRRHPDHRLAQSARVQRLQAVDRHGVAARRRDPGAL